MVRRVAPVLAAAAVGLLALAYGAAASLGINGASLGAGGAAVQPCDTSFTRSLTVSGGNVTQVTIGDVAGACGGGQMTVVLTNASGAKVGDGSASVPSGGGSVTVPIDEQPSVGSVRNVHVVVVGP